MKINTQIPHSQEFSSLLCHSGVSLSTQRSVISLNSNGFDLLDMAGNGWEWTPDEYRADAYASPSNTESESAAVQTRVMRGGSMYSERSSLRVSYRGRSNPGNRLFYVGFRCVRDAAP